MKKRSFKIATAFTGAAAVAATFTPAANAATHPVMHGRYHKLPLVEGNAAGATPQTAIHSGPCSVHPTWLHIEWYNSYKSQGNPYLTCLGFAGTYHVSAMRMISQCGGNNHGYFDSGTSKLTFKAGTTYRTFTGYGYPTWQIHISGWAGSDTCPL